MKHILSAVALLLALCATGLAQQTDDTPATKEDVQKYFAVMHSRELTAKMVEAMIKPMHQMVHEQYMKEKDKLPEDFEARMNRQMDDMLRDMPWDEMLEAEMPAFQKHLTKGDLDAIVTFYGSPTGQKLLREMPAILAESMEAMMPSLRRYLDRIQERVQQETAQMLKNSEKKTTQPSPVKN